MRRRTAHALWRGEWRGGSRARALSWARLREVLPKAALSCKGTGRRPGGDWGEAGLSCARRGRGAALTLLRAECELDA